MNTHPTLWRIDGMTDTTAIDHDRLAAGLPLHVAHSALTSVAMQIGTRQQCYVVLDGCTGCLTEQCRIGCHAALFRRLIAACIDGVEVRAVAQPQGLAQRPYTRGLLARPSPAAQPLDTALLHRWEEARLIVHWRRVRMRIQAAALLLTSDADPDPAEALGTRGWRSLLLPKAVLRYWGQRALPPALPFGASWRHPLTLLLPSIGASSTVPSTETRDSARPMAAPTEQAPP
jgi:hypothetical protein